MEVLFNIRLKFLVTETSTSWITGVQSAGKYVRWNSLVISAKTEVSVWQGVLSKNNKVLSFTSESNKRRGKV